jgi:hypothetical protein
MGNKIIKILLMVIMLGIAGALVAGAYYIENDISGGVVSAEGAFISAIPIFFLASCALLALGKAFGNLNQTRDRHEREQNEY